MLSNVVNLQQEVKDLWYIEHIGFFLGLLVWSPPPANQKLGVKEEAKAGFDWLR